MRYYILREGPRLRRAILLAVIAGVPLLFTRFTNDPINVPKLAFLIAGFLVVAAVRGAEITQGAGWTGLRRLAVPAGALAFGLSVAWIFSPHKAWSLFGEYGRYQGLIPYLVVIGLGVLIADAFEGERVKQTLWALGLGAAVVGSYALIQAVGLDPLEWAVAGGATTQASSTLGNSNFTGGFLAVVLPVYAGLWVLSPKHRVVIVGMAMASAAGWIVAESEGAWAAGAAGLAITGGLLGVGRWRRAPLAGSVIAAVIALAVVGVISVSVADPPKVGSKPGTVALRAFAWNAALGMIADAPIVGKGPNAYALSGVSYRSEADAGSLAGDFPDDPHSVFLSLVAGGGALTAIAIVVVGGWVVAVSRREGPSLTLTAVLLGVCTAYVVEGIGNIDELSIRLALWVALGGLGGSLARRDEDMPPEVVGPGSRSKRARKKPTRSILALVLLLAIAVGGVWWSGQLILADARVRWGLDRINRGDVVGGALDLNRAASFRNEIRYRLESGEAISQLAIAQADPNLFDKARDSFAYLEETGHLVGLVSYGRALDDWSQFDPTAMEEALEVYERAVRIDPLNPLLRVEMADVLLDLSRPEAALAVLEPAIRIGGDRHAAVWGAVAVARLNSGDPVGAAEAVDEALTLDPGEPQALAVAAALST